MAECAENINTIRLGEYESINSSNVTIITGYMQIYTRYGPKCGPNEYMPIRIIPISSNMVDSLFKTYLVQNNIKLIYEEVNGILIDSFV